MNKKLLIAFVVLVVALAGGSLALYFLHRSRCSSCENGCEFTMGIIAKQCKCQGCITGTKCDKHGKCMCPPKCAAPSGECQKDGSCKCQSGYTGTDCTTPMCPPKCAAPSGECQKDGSCKCQSGYTGTDCTTPPKSSIPKSAQAFIDWAVKKLKKTCPNISADAVARVMQKAGDYQFGNWLQAAQSLYKIEQALCKGD
jgi:hypothetical protein